MAHRHLFWDTLPVQDVGPRDDLARAGETQTIAGELLEAVTGP
jgi:hypothetical protein